jgi:hypothetical protein
MVKIHWFFFDFCKLPSKSTNNQMTEETIDCADSALENLLHWTYSFVSSIYYTYFYQVTWARTTIQKLILIINSGTVNSALKLAQLDIKVRKAAGFRIKSPKLYAVVMNSNESCWIFIVELYVSAFLIVLVCCKLTCFWFTFFHVPTHNLVCISLTS